MVVSCKFKKELRKETANTWLKNFKKNLENKH